MTYELPEIPEDPDDKRNRLAFGRIVIVGVWVIVAVLIILIWSTLKSHAATDEVCKPYASQVLNNQMQWLWDRAFNHCKLLEEDNPTPPATGDWKATLDILVVPDYGKPPTPATPIAKLGIAPATDDPNKTKPKPTPRTASGAPVQAAAEAPPKQTAAADPSRLAKCKSAHPQGYKSDGTYNKLIGGKWVRTPCP